jgi:hypothetical protein
VITVGAGSEAVLRIAYCVSGGDWGPPSLGASARRAGIDKVGDKVGDKVPELIRVPAGIV